MSGAMTATTDQWMQFYQQPLMDGMAPIEGLSDATVVTTTSPTMSSEGMLSPSNSYTTHGQLTPKGNAFKPIKKRSRASKRTPTTLLNANTNNFRELVQQFTGRASTAMSPFAVHKGPITLNFQQGIRQQIRHDTSGTTSPFGTRTYYNQPHHVAVPLPWQKQQDQVPKQQSGYSLDHVKSSDSPSSCVNSRPSMEASDGLLMVDDFGLHELSLNAFSNDIKSDGFLM